MVNKKIDRERQLKMLWLRHSAIDPDTPLLWRPMFDLRELPGRQQESAFAVFDFAGFTDTEPESGG